MNQNQSSHDKFLMVQLFCADLMATDRRFFPVFSAFLLKRCECIPRILFDHNFAHLITARFAENEKKKNCFQP